MWLVTHYNHSRSEGYSVGFYKIFIGSYNVLGSESYTKIL